MRYTLLAFLLAFPMLLHAQQSIDQFQQRWEAASSDQQRVEMAREAIQQSNDIDFIRQVQDMWEEIDRPSAVEWFGRQMDQEATAQNIYLRGRLGDKAVDQLMYARRAIETDPNFPYSYRLLVVPYMNVLFRDQQADPEYGTLANSWEEDYELLMDHKPYLVEDEVGMSLMYEAQVYEKDYDGQLETLNQAERSGADWGTAQRWANAYVGKGDYATAREDLNRRLDKAVEEGELEPAMRQEAFLYRYGSALDEANAHDEAVRYLGSVDDPNLRAEAQVYLAAAYLKQDMVDEAFGALRQAVEYGFESPMELERNDTFDSIRDRDEYDAVMAGVEANRQAGSDDRKKEALAEKMNQPAPEMRLVGTDGNEIALADLRGKMVVIDFWATWCGPCRMAMPVINEFTRAHSDKDIEVISLNVWENVPEKAEQFMKENDYAMRLMWPVGEGRRGATDKFEVSGIPTLVVIDKEGVIRYKEVGFSEGLGEKLAWYAEDLLGL